MFLDFFYISPAPLNSPHTHYNYYLVALSYFIAVLASYVALDIAIGLQAKKASTHKIYWLINGSIAMGSGIWAMHFIGMLAFKMSLPVRYNLFWTGISLFVAIISSLFALTLIRSKKKFLISILAGFLLGIGIVLMHYIGIYAMRGPFQIQFRPYLFILSIIIAIVTSELALFAALKSNQILFKKKTLLKMLSAFIMGFAICGMHYTGMSATIITPWVNDATKDDIRDFGLTFYIAGVSIFILGIAIITSSYKQQLASVIQNEKDFLNAILHNINDGILAFNVNEKKLIMNPAMKEMIDVHEEIVSLEKLIEKYEFYNSDSEVTLSSQENPILLTMKGKYIHNFELDLLVKDEKKLHILFDGQPIENAEGKIIGGVVVIHDITYRKLLENFLMIQATHDSLTKLPNRILLLQHIDKGIQSVQKNQHFLAILFVDLDYFKNINDSFGHIVGDDLLKIIGTRLKNYVKKKDIVSRLGGDEFVILLTLIKMKEEAKALAYELLNEISQPIEIKNHFIQITASIGISYYPGNGEDSIQLLKNADIAMYRVKLHSRNGVSEY